MPEVSPIVIAYDGSDAARAAVNEAAALFGSRHAIVLTVWEPGLADFMLMPNTMGTGTMMMPYDPATVQAIDKAAEDHATGHRRGRSEARPGRRPAGRGAAGS